MRILDRRLRRQDAARVDQWMAAYSDDVSLYHELLRACKRDGRNPNRADEPRSFVQSFSEEARGALFKALQSNIDRKAARRSMQAHYEQMSAGTHFVDRRPAQIVVKPGGALSLDIWDQDLRAEAKALEQRIAAENEARSQQRHDAAESARTAREADAEFVRTHTPPGIPTS